MTTIHATVGEPYEIEPTGTGLIRLSRQLGTREVHLVFGVADALAVADALVDAAERL
ncbi:hypothetical protein [Mycolicibacterium moriokaense]|uniref:Uncharacterized protein n=1 Tax=Mycolicibacterium moriokaense TaxID=39691 RepID=A0AAD1M6Y3_9MYCO|nr:hypothetical protein [Mycolicibacterium moriokaense]MCV7039689.1 hypothetical protein [Mycolicibacterium moriokaense]BBX01864.1 hypothetical protein MMOR_28000 [Mycolicibacterium moriokaense]